MNSRSTALLIQLSKYPHVTELAIDCHLEIEAPKNQGLQVVIEDINLRRNPLDNECDDYVWVSSYLMVWSIRLALIILFFFPSSLAEMMMGSSAKNSVVRGSWFPSMIILGKGQ